MPSLDDFPDLTPAETELLRACAAGEPAVLGPSRPTAPTPGTQIRAGLIRYLMLGGCPACRPDPKGVEARGAFITGRLDLEARTSDLDLLLANCTFDTQPILRDARLRALYLPGSKLPGLDAQRLRTEGSLHLSNGFHAAGTVDLGGAQIGGQICLMDCMALGTWRAGASTARTAAMAAMRSMAMGSR